MLKRIVGAMVLVGALIATSLPAGATCQPGYVGVKDGKPVVQLPRCEGPPR